MKPSRKIKLTRELQDLEGNPPKNLPHVYKVLKKCTQKILNHLEYIEDTFYSGKSALHEIKKWTESIRISMNTLSLSSLSSVDDFEYTLRQRSESMEQGQIYDVNKLWNCYFKIRQYIPGRFEEIIGQLNLILQFLLKYCVSFYDEESNVYLETSAHYEKARRDWKKLIEEYLKRLVVIPQKFEKYVLLQDDFSNYGMDIIKHTRMNKALFIVIFPELCWNIRKICTVVEEWLKTDSSYNSFITHDIKDLEEKRANILGKIRDIQDKYHQTKFRCSQVSKECEQVQKQQEKVSENEMELLNKYSIMSSECNDMKLEIEIKEFRREDLIKKASQLDQQLLYERYNELSAAIRDLKRKLPVVQRELAALGRKIATINDTKKRREEKNKQLKHLMKELEKIESKQQKMEEEITHTEETLQVAKKIYWYKKSPDTLQKLFHKQLLQVFWTAEETPEEDPFDIACDVVAKNIEMDWSKLYQNLPFIPGRGERIIEKDIRDLSETCNRHSIELLAKRSIVRWRRFHNRPTMDDLMNALIKINRRDVVEMVDLTLNPPEEEEEPEDPIPSFLDPDLISCYRQVERFNVILQSQKVT